MARRQQLKELITPFSGIDQSNQSTLIPEGLSPRSQNVLYDYGEIVQTEGTVSYGGDSGTVMPFGSGSEEVQGFSNYEQDDGSVELICVTTRNVYRYVSAHKTWTAINPGVGASIVDDHTGSGSQWISYTDHTSAADTRPTSGASEATKWLETSYGSDGHAGWTTSASYVDGTLAGSTTSFVSFTHAIHSPLVVDSDDKLTAGKYLIINNGIDDVFMYDGDSVFPLRTWESSAYVYRKAKQTIFFNSCLVQIGPKNASTSVRSPQQVLWSAVSDILDWNSTSSASTSGFFVLADTAGELLRAEPLGNNILAVYKTDAIYNLIPTHGISVFAVNLAVSGAGLISQGSVAVLEDRHILISSDGFYEYRGGGQVLRMGDNVWREFITDLDYENKHRILSRVDKENSRVRFYFPSKLDGSGSCTRSIIYDYAEDWWSIGELKGNVTSIGSFLSATTRTWSELAGTWSAQTETWDELAPSQGDQITLLGDSSGYTYQFNVNTYTERKLATDAIIEQIHETKDFTSADFVGRGYKDRYFTIMGVILDAKGRRLDFWYSTDEGVTFVEVTSGGQALTGAYVRYKIDFKATARTIRFKIENKTTDSYYNLRSRIGIRFIVREKSG